MVPERRGRDHGLVLHTVLARSRAVLASRWARVGGTAAGLYLVLHNINVVAAGRALSHANPGWLLLGLVLSIASVMSSIGQWGVLLHGVGHRISAVRLIGLHLEGFFVGAILPGAVGGDAMRVVAISPQTGAGTAVASLTGSRMAGTTGMAFWGLAGAVLIHGLIGTPGLIGAAGFALAMTVAWVLALYADRIVGRIDPTRGAIRHRVHAILSPFAGTFRAFRGRPRVVVRCIVVGLIGWGVNLVALVAFARALGMHADWTVFAVAIPVTLLATLSPVSVNGYGVREGVLVGLLAHAGVGAANAGAFSVLVDLQVVPFVLAGAVIWFARSRGRRGERAGAVAAPAGVVAVATAA